MAIGKRLEKAREGVDREKLYPLADAIKMVKERAKSKFDETIEIAINLGVDPRHADQMVRGVVNLPNGTGRTLRVGVFQSVGMRVLPAIMTRFAQVWPGVEVRLSEAPDMGRAGRLREAPLPPDMSNVIRG